MHDNNTDLHQAFKGEPFRSVFSSDGTLTSASGTPHSVGGRRVSQLVGALSPERKDANTTNKIKYYLFRFLFVLLLQMLLLLLLFLLTL